MNRPVRYHVPVESRDPGFLIEPEVLSPAECDAVLAVLDRVPARGRAGMRHLMAIPEIAALASDSRLLNIARQRLAANAIPFRATLFEKSAQTNWLIPWHQDTALPLTAKFDSADWAAWSQKEGRLYAHAPAWALSRVIALRIHLDASTAENGPLRVLPYSQQAGVLNDRAIFDYASERQSVECLVPRGGVLAMRPLLIHSSSKGRTAAARRVLHIEYSDSLDLAPAIQLAIA